GKRALLGGTDRMNLPEICPSGQADELGAREDAVVVLRVPCVCQKPELMTRWNRLSWLDDRASLFRADRPSLPTQLEAESAVLRHQLMVLRPRLRGRVRLTNHDRWFFIRPHKR